MNPVENLAALRAEMAKRRIDAYVVVTDDFHTSEYVGARISLRLHRLRRYARRAA